MIEVESPWEKAAWFTTAAKSLEEYYGPDDDADDIVVLPSGHESEHHLKENCDDKRSYDYYDSWSDWIGGSDTNDMSDTSQMVRHPLPFVSSFSLDNGNLMLSYQPELEDCLVPQWSEGGSKEALQLLVISAKGPADVKEAILYQAFYHQIRQLLSDKEKTINIHSANRLGGFFRCTQRDTQALPLMTHEASTWSRPGRQVSLREEIDDRARLVRRSQSTATATGEVISPDMLKER